jgi:WD40 repeat protein
MVIISRGRIFICYRRRDTRDLAGRLGDSLVAHFGEDDIFMDVDAIEPGLDFANEITKAVASCDVLLAVIGHKWLTITDSAGRRRLDNPNDFVRLEIETALQREIRVIPVLTDDATLPREDELPESIADLIRRQVVQIRFDRYHDDIGRLISVIEKVLGGQAPKRLARANELEPAPNSPSESSQASSLEGPSPGLRHEGPAVVRVEPDLIRVLQHDDVILRVAFSPDSRVLVTASKDETARLWGEDGQQIHQLLHSGWVKDISFSYDGELLATITTADNIIRLWDPQTGLIVYRFTADSPKKVIFSRDSKLVAAFSDSYIQKEIDVWKRYGNTFVEERQLKLHTEALSLDFGTSGHLAIAIGNTAQIWDANRGVSKDRLVHKDVVNSVHFNQDGTLLITGSDDGTARIWDSKTGQEYHRLRHGDSVEFTLFSPDDRLISTVSGNDVFIWDPKTGHKYRQLQHDDHIQQVQFSPDGRLLVTSSGSTAHIWNPGTGDKYHQLRHDQDVQQAQFSPDGQLLVTCSGNSAEVWRMQDS